MADDRRQREEDQANEILDDMLKDNEILPLIRYALEFGDDRLRESAMLVRHYYNNGRNGNVFEAELLRDSLNDLLAELGSSGAVIQDWEDGYLRNLGLMERRGRGMVQGGRYTGTRFGGCKGRGSKYVFI